MPISDLYTVRFTATLAGTSATAIGSLVAGTTVRLWVVKIAFEVGNTAAVAGNNILFQLCRPGNTMTGTTTVTPNPHDFSAPASIGTAYSAWSTAPTVGAILDDWELPQASGSEGLEYPPTGYEWQVPAIANAAANAGLHLFATASASTSTPIIANVTFSQ